MDPNVIIAVNDTRSAKQEFSTLEKNRNQISIIFIILYLVATLILILISIIVGIGIDASDISVFIFVYFLTNLNLIGFKPIKSSETKIWPSQLTEEPIPIVGIFKAFVISLAKLVSIHSKTIENTPFF